MNKLIMMGASTAGAFPACASLSGAHMIASRESMIAALMFDNSANAPDGGAHASVSHDGVSHDGAPTALGRFILRLADWAIPTPGAIHSTTAKEGTR